MGEREAGRGHGLGSMTSDPRGRLVRLGHVARQAREADSEHPETNLLETFISYMTVSGSWFMGNIFKDCFEY